MDTEKLSEEYGTTQEWIREIIGELLGTFLMVFIGNCGIAQATMSEEGTPETMHFSYGIAYTVGILVAGASSGAHINPAVTLAFVTIGKLHWSKIFHYFAGQYLGAFIAAIFTYAIYADCIYDIDLGHRKTIGPASTADIFTTLPEEHVSLVLVFLDQILGTFILMLIICALTDKLNLEVHRTLYALYIGLTVITIAVSLGHISKYPINPARDFSPRMFVAVAGWGGEPFTYRTAFWIPIIAPHIGAILGAITYVFLIGIHLPSEESELPENETFEFKAERV